MNSTRKMREALEAAKEEILWWASEHRCCAGCEDATMAKITAALSAQGEAKPEPQPTAAAPDVLAMREALQYAHGTLLMCKKSLEREGYDTGCEEAALAKITAALSAQGEAKPEPRAEVRVVSPVVMLRQWRTNESMDWCTLDSTSASEAPKHIRAQGYQVRELGVIEARVPEPRAAEPALALDDDLLTHAASLLEGYVEFIRCAAMADIELHPYLPEIEDVAEQLRTLAAASPIATPEPQEGRNHGLDTDEHVRFYEHDFYPLSNFSAFNLRWQGLTFPTSEHAYHCQKFRGNERRFQIASAPSAHEAFKIAERHKGERRKDWDDVKVGIMREILLAKVVQHEYVRRKLLATGDRTLIEDSWRDDFWGWGPNRDGQNMLGKLWMEIRAEIRTHDGERDHG